MEAKAKARFVRVTPQKARRVVDLIRGKQAGEAVAVLKFAPQAAGETVLKVVESAIANAREAAKRSNERLDEADLYISEVFVDEGPTLKRFRPRAQGRASRIRKRTCHITVAVEAVQVTAPARKAAAKKAAPAKQAAQPAEPQSSTEGAE